MRSKLRDIIPVKDLLNTTQPLEAARTLPTVAYTSNAVYQREKDQLFSKNWLPVARLEQLEKPGDFICLDLMDQPIIIVRSRDGVVRILSNVCLHRGSQLAEGTGNKTKFTCPYHAWSFDTKGQLLAAPMMEESEDFDIKQCRLPEIRSELWQGFVMANLDPEAEPFAPSIAPFTTYFASYQMADLKIARTIDYEHQWNWKVLVENFMEAYHHIATHSETLQPLYPARKASVPDNTGPYSILKMPSDDQDSEHPTVLYANVIFPYFIFALQGDTLIWYQITPTSSDSLKLQIHICVKETEMTDAAKLDDAEALVKYIHSEDILANDKVWRGLQAPLTQQGRLSIYEKSIWQMNQWWVEQMKDTE